MTKFASISVLFIVFSVLASVLVAHPSIGQECSPVQALQNDDGWELPAAITKAEVSERTAASRKSGLVGYVARLNIPSDQLVVRVAFVSEQQGLVSLRHARLRFRWISRVDLDGRVYKYFGRAVELSQSEDVSLGREWDVAWTDTTGTGKFDKFRWVGKPSDDIPGWVRSLASR